MPGMLKTNNLETVNSTVKPDNKLTLVGTVPAVIPRQSDGLGDYVLLST